MIGLEVRPENQTRYSSYIEAETDDREIYGNVVKGFPVMASLFHQCVIRSGAKTMKALWRNIFSSSTNCLFWMMLSATTLLFPDPTHT